MRLDERVSRENVEIARRANAAFNRGDAEACAECFDSRGEMIDLRNAPDLPQRISGHAAIKDSIRAWSAAFDEFWAEVEEYTPIGDHVVCVVHWHGRGKDSGVSVDTHQIDVYECRDGRIVQGTLGYPSKDAALEAAGLRNSHVAGERRDVARSDVLRP